MLLLENHTYIYVAKDPLDFRKGIDGTLSIKQDNNEKSLTTAGLLVFVTNHIEKFEEGTQNYQVSARDIIGHYKAKIVIENSFRELKTYLRLRPIHVWTSDHVYAHFDIAIVAYFINNYIYRALKDQGISLREFYSELNKQSRAVVLRTTKGHAITRSEKPSELLASALRYLSIEKRVQELTNAGTNHVHGA